MKHSISIDISPEELKDILREVVDEKLQVVNNVLGFIKISAQEARKILAVKSHNTLMGYVKDGYLNNYAKGNEHPKFSLSEVVELSKLKRHV